MRRSQFDAFAGQPLHPVAIAALQASAAKSWADPTAGYREGAEARQLLDASRATVAAVVGVSQDRVSFRRSGEDAATAGAALVTPAAAPRRIAASTVERQVILSAIAMGREQPISIDVDADGQVDVDRLASAVTQLPALLALQVANIELGCLQPLAMAVELCQARGVPVLTDATGALGVIPIPPGWSVLVADAAGWAGPREAAVVVAPPRRPAPPDTLGLAATIATAAALDAVWRESSAVAPRLHELTARIRESVPANISGAHVLGPAHHRLPNVVSIAFPDLDASLLQSELDKLGVAAASGSACADRSGQPSHVLQAAGLITVGNLRVSLPWRCDEDAVSHFLQVLPEAVARARSFTDVAAPSTAADRVAVDALGLRCPAPIIKLGRLTATLAPNTLIELSTDDPAAELDVRAWCRLAQAELISQSPLADVPGGWVHLVRLNAGSSVNASSSNST